MSLSASDTRELFARECRFPTERQSVIDEVGDATIEPPTGDSVSVGTVLERSEEEQFSSVTELHNTLLANLDDDHIGRKYYDDRSTTSQPVAEQPI